jgi:hypothetical protein
MGRFTNSEVALATLARDFQRRMVYIKDDSIKSMVAGKNHIPFSAIDVDNATTI